jgi:hypothetical protein
MLDTQHLVQAAAAAAKQHDAAIGAALQPLPPASKRLSMTFPIGTAVIDLVTGQKGTVIDGERANTILPSTANAGH